MQLLSGHMAESAGLSLNGHAPLGQGRIVHSGAFSVFIVFTMVVVFVREQKRPGIRRVS
jgi:hypothetical protein